MNGVAGHGLFGQRHFFAPMQRLQHSAQFQAVMQGSVVGRTPHFMLHALHWQPQAAPQGKPLIRAGRYLGVLVPKRWARRAVTRSTIKRQMRAVCAEHASQIPHCTALVVRLRSGFDRRIFISATSEPLKQAVRLELQQLFASVRWEQLQVVPVPCVLAPAPSRPSGTMCAAP